VLAAIPAGSDPLFGESSSRANRELRRQIALAAPEAEFYLDPCPAGGSVFARLASVMFPSPRRGRGAGVRGNQNHIF